MALAEAIVHDTVRTDHPTRVVVQDQWNGWRTAMVLLADLEDVRWLQPAGAPRPLIHAHVSCSKLHPGDLRHTCDGAAPHAVLVCVLKSHTAPRVFAELARRASSGAAGSSSSLHPEIS